MKIKLTLLNHENNQECGVIFEPKFFLFFKKGKIKNFRFKQESDLVYINVHKNSNYRKTIKNINQILKLLRELN